MLLGDIALMVRGATAEGGMFVQAIAIGYQAPPGAQLDAGLYGRSISYVPDSPALPAPFR